MFALCYQSMRLIELNLRHAAVDEQLDAVDVAAVIRREEHDRISDLIGCACATQRCGTSDLRLELLDLLGDQPNSVL